MTLTKDQIVNSVHDQLGFPKNRSIELVESVLEIIKDTLENGEDVLISGFGKFCVRD
jgi:integration host factor subunit alpha